MTQKQTAATGDVPIRRTTEIEEITNLYLIHPLASRLVPIFARLHVTPNAVSIVGMSFGILSAFAYYRYWDPRSAVAGFALMVAWHVMDGADGQLARYTQSYSYFGKMLDGIADHVTFVAVYAALAVTSSRRHGNWVYLLVAISAVSHAIQSASYETERQEYEYLGWGKKPQDPPPRNSEARDRGGPGGIRRLLDFLHRLFFFGLSFPTAGINRKFRETMAHALQNDPGKAVLLRQHYRETLAPQIRSWSVLSANYRTLGIFLSTLFKAPEYYFGFEIVGFSVILAVLIRRLNSAHEVLLTNLRFHHCGVVLAFALLTLGTAGPVHAQATAYLPLNLEPEMERQVERVLILADEPILKRPYSVELVTQALPQACRVDPVLCRRVRRYLERYSRDYAVTHASITGSYTHNGAGDVVPNEHGLQENSHYDLSIAAFVQPTDYLLASAGGVSYKGRTVPTGSMLTLGTHWAQIDVGYRDHWLSPLTDTSALLSTEAPTTPSITLSNWEPLTRLGFQYEFFLTRLSSQPISYNGVEQEGQPRVFGSQFSIEPFPGWSLGINRMLEFGGGSGLPSSASFLARQFFRPSGLSQTQGNQQASYVTRFVSPTRVPFALYFQYAGEDTELGGAFLLGSPMMSGGIDFPRVLRHFDVTYEISEWSNIWYVQNIFMYGMSQYQLVLGAWGADQRNFGDGVGARSQMLRVGWSPRFGGYLEGKVRLLTNQNYFGGDIREYDPADKAYPYHHYVDVSVRYTRPWNGLTLGGEAEGGHDVFGKNFARLSGFVRYGGDSRTRDEVDDDTDDEDETRAARPPQGAEWFVDIGGNANRVITANAPSPSEASSPHFGAHLALGGRRAVSEHNDFGARVEYDEGVDGHYLIGFRALDWRYRFNNPLALGLFLGAARYSTITPATSLYAGLGVQWRDIWRHWDVDLDGRYGDNLARDHVLASDIQGTRPETFYRIQSLALYLSRHF